MRHELWIDADDTLWENNIFFEDVFDRFVALLQHAGMSSAEIRVALDEIERVNNRIHGYGAANFVRNLGQCWQKLSGREATEIETAAMIAWEDELAHHPLHLVEEVEETLAYLAQRHNLVLCTKGNPVEQRAKVTRSGLEAHFHEVRVVREKDAACYHALAEERKVNRDFCWMIGNSPKSDINPALEAGIGAVYIPHPRTWHLEHEEVPDKHNRLLVLKRFAQLRDHF